MSQVASSNVAARRIGACVGFVIAGAIVGLAFVIDAVAAGNPIGPTAAVPTLAAGTAGGWLVGPSGARASSRRDWISTILKLGLLALLVGALVEGQILALGTTSTIAPDGAEILELPIRAVVGLYMAAVGFVFLGVFIAPLTLAAAWVWVAVMVRVAGRQRAPGRP